jgi:hypothetical protein
MSAQPSDNSRHFVRWGELSAPVDPEETRTCMRAQSILSGPLIGQCPPLPIDQARDVIAWYRPQDQLTPEEFR